MLKRSKKGFTLAELLIVVAIIAVLVAIAVPLFVSSLTKAQDATKDANIRSVRGAAVIAILSAEKPATPSTGSETDKVYTLTGTKEANNLDWELKGPWIATGKLDGTGNITSVTIAVATATEWDSAQSKWNENYGEDTVSTDGTTVTVYLTMTSLNPTT